MHIAASTLRLDTGAIIGGSPVPLDVDVKQVDRVPGSPERGQSQIVTVISRGTPGQGRAADFAITADLLTLNGAAAISSSTPNAQPGGTITIDAGQVQLTGGARIESRSGIADATGAIVSGPGPGGQIHLTATDQVTLTGSQSGLFASTAGEGPGGAIILSAPRVQLTEGATIAAQSTGSGAAGTIQLTEADTLLLRGNSAITTDARQASGGAIQVTARTLVRLHDSEITTSVQGGDGQAGNITIDPQAVVLQNGQIRANAVEGRGGNITIRAGVFLADPTSAVTASYETNIAGTIAIRAPIANLSGIVAPLPQTLAAAEGLLRNRCLARLREGTVSTLVVRGRVGVSTAPDGVLPGQLPAPPAVTEATPAPPAHSQEPGTLPVSPRHQGRPPTGGTLPPLVLALGCGA